MPDFYFGKRSRSKLATVHPFLRETVEETLALTPFDFTILHGWRGQREQDALFDSRASRKRWPNSKHNHMRDGKPLSLAVDFAPWVDGDIDWEDTNSFAFLAGIMQAVAVKKGVKLRWGGDWDADGNTREHTLQDLGHVEILL